MSSTVDVDALVGWHITLSAFPPAVALAAATGVLAITTAQHWTGSWTRHMQEDGSVRQTGFINGLNQTLEPTKFPLSYDIFTPKSTEICFDMVLLDYCTCSKTVLGYVK